MTLKFPSTFNATTAHSTPSYVNKKKTLTDNNPLSRSYADMVGKPPMKMTDSTQLSRSYADMLGSSDNVSATPTTPARDAYVNNVAGQSSTQNKTDYSGLVTGLQNLSTALGKGTPATPAPTKPPVDYYANTRDAMDRYVRSLQPGDREQDMERRLDSLYRATRSGVARQEEDAIPMNFITGRQATIENRGRELTEPYEDELKRMADDRTNMSAAEKARYEFEFGLANTQRTEDREDASAAAKGNEPKFEKVGNNIIQIKPDGSYEMVYQAPADVETQIIQSGGKNVLINSTTGEILSDLGATEGSLNRAKSGSGSGDKDNVYDLKSITPQMQANIFSSISAANADGKELSINELAAMFPEVGLEAIQEFILNQNPEATKKPNGFMQWFRDTF